MASLLPVLAVTVPPLVDYPEHLARVVVEARYSQDPDLQRLYELDWSLRPNMNLAMDLVTPALVGPLSPWWAGKVFILATMLLQISGTWALARRLGSSGAAGPWYAGILAYPILYGLPFQHGLVNFLFGLGLALWGLAFWLSTRHWRLWLRLPLIALIGGAVMVAHAMAFGVLAAAAFWFEVGFRLPMGRDPAYPPRKWRDAAALLALAAIPLGLALPTLGVPVVANGGFEPPGSQSMLDVVKSPWVVFMEAPLPGRGVAGPCRVSGRWPARFHCEKCPGSPCCLTG
ncbi:hypothetical protein [Azospirillum sp. B4]|uniref:hypothetical protein n=1 Tax=Azospirillum sp. B4 TaxID=95605 RepID=UPI0011DE4A67|nr:hypothetical protein [Azospirillum sp. B4]